MDLWHWNMQKNTLNMYLTWYLLRWDLAITLNINKQLTLILENSVCPQRKLVLKENLQHFLAEIEAHPEQRFIKFCLRLGAEFGMILTSMLRHYGKTWKSICKLLIIFGALFFVI